MTEINVEVKIVCVHFWFRTGSVIDGLKNEKHEKLTKTENSKPRGIV